MQLPISAVVLSLLIVGAASARVLELGEKFLQFKNKEEWLVKFYAPWCTHCKKLEPVWEQVSQRLVNTDVRVSRLDCTRYAHVAQKFKVSGFPTIMYITKDKQVEYNGERSLDPILEFVRRVHGPPLRKVESCIEMENVIKGSSHATFLLGRHSDGHGEADELIKNFTSHAEHMYAFNYFLEVPIICVDKTRAHSWVYVHKDNTVHSFDSGKFPGLETWIISERFPAFQRISHGNFYQIMATKKHLVAVAVEENQIGKLETLKMEEVKDMLEALAVNTRHIYHDDFLFGWFPQTEIPYSIAMTELRLPTVMIIEPEQFKYYLPKTSDNPEDTVELMNQIKKSDPLPPSYGGNSLPYRIYRSYFEMVRNLKNLYRSSPVLTVVIFVVPLGFFAAIIYLTCCSDFLEASDEDDEDGEDDHEKLD